MELSADRKRGRTWLASAALSAALILGGCNDGAGDWPAVAVTWPNGGETLVGGSTVTVTWSSAGDVGDVTIELSTDGGSSWTVLVPSAANDGEEFIVVPESPGAQCLIRVSAVDGVAGDESDGEFEILPPPVRLAWAKRAGGSDWDEGKGVAVLEDGSVFVTGIFDGTVTFGSGEANETALTSATSCDTFLARYDQDGALVWARCDRAVAYGVAAAPDGYAFVTGYFWGTSTFGQGEANETTLTSAGSLNVFLARYNPDGTLAWATSAGGADTAVGCGLAVLSDGSTFVTGPFRGTVTFGLGEANETVLASAGNGDMFLARYNADGTLAWARGVGAAEWDQGHGVAALSDGSVFVTGSFAETVTFGPGEANETVLTSVSAGDIFLARYNAGGTLAWAKSAGGGGSQLGASVAALPDGSAYVVGRLRGTVTFGSGEAGETVLTAPVGSYDVFLARYEADGTLAWAKRAGGNDMAYGTAVAALSDGTAYITGHFIDTATFGPAEASETTLVAEGYDIFLACYNSDGTLAWARQDGGSFSLSHGLAVLSDGTTFVTGESRGPATFGAGEGNETSFTQEGLFLARYNADSTLAWARRAGDGSEEEVTAVAALSDGSSFVSGWFRGTVTFGSGEPGEITVTSAGSRDIFLARYDPDGTLAWGKRVGGTLSDSGESVAVFSDGSAFITGHFSGDVTFGPGEVNETILSPAGSGDIFLARYNGDGTLAWAERAGGTRMDEGHAVSVLSDGSALVAGYFGYSAVFGEGEGSETTLDAAAGYGIFVARHNPDGTLAWAKTVCETPYTSEQSVGTTSDGSAYLTGTCQGTTVFGAGDANETTLTSAGWTDIFVARYNPDGTLAWARNAGGAGIDYGYGISALSDGSAFVTGSFQETATFGEGDANETNLDAGSGWDILLARYNADGTLAWAVSAGREGAGMGYGVAALSDAYALVTGDYYQTSTFGAGEPNETTLPSEGGDDIFLARYNADGTLDWVRRAGGTWSEDRGIGVAVIPGGSAVITGRFRGAATFGHGELNETTLTSAGAYNICLAPVGAFISPQSTRPFGR